MGRKRMAEVRKRMAEVRERMAEMRKSMAVVRKRMDVRWMCDCSDFEPCPPQLPHCCGM